MLGKPASYMPVIMPERLAASAGRSAVTEIIGSGPYRFAPGERVAGSRNVYTRFDSYVPREGTPSFLAGSKQAHFDRIEWHTLPDPSTAAALQSGEIDWWEQTTADLIPLLRRHRDIKVEVLEDVLATSPCCASTMCSRPSTIGDPARAAERDEPSRFHDGGSQ